MRPWYRNIHGPLRGDTGQRKITPLFIPCAQLDDLLRTVRAQVQVESGVNVIADIPPILQPAHCGDGVEQTDKVDGTLKIGG